VAPRLSAVSLAVAVTAVLVAPELVPTDPLRQSLADALSPPSLDAPFGRDHLGRCVATRLVYGARLSLAIGLGATLSAVAIGVSLGLASARLGGVVDAVIDRAIDIAYGFPGLLLVMVLATLFGSGPVGLTAALTLAAWPDYARLTRLLGRAQLARAHVEAARLMALPELVVLYRHVWPGLAPQIASLASFGVGQAILTISALGFLGLGLRPPTPEWGAMVAEGLSHWHEAPWMLVAPVTAIALTVLGLQAVAGRRRALDGG